MRKQYVYLSDMFKDLFDVVHEYVGETEHMLDPETEWVTNEAELYEDFAKYIKVKAECLRKGE